MIKFFVNRPLFTLAVFIVLGMIGIFCYTSLPRDQFPDIKFSTLTVVTVYPGASAEDIETTVTKKIEDTLATVPNVEKIESSSGENVSSVILTFKYGTSLDEAAADVRDKLELVQSTLPEDAKKPTIYKFDMTMIPVMTLGISAGESYNNLYQISDKIISDSLKRVPGVGSVSLTGGLKRQINVALDRTRLEAYRISLNQIISVIQSSNLSLPAGSLQIGTQDYSVRIPGEFSSVEQISGTIVGNYLGRNIYLKDVARVTDDYKEQTSVVRVDGQPGIQVSIQKQSGANTIAVVAGIQSELKKIRQRIPADVVITETWDGSEMIRRSLSNLNETLFFGALFVILTVYFFLRNFRGALIINLVLPFSLIAAYIYLFFSGGSLNMISLSAIVISIGAVVDNAIVVFENIFRHHEERGEAPREAAMYGAGEVAGAVAASTTTNLIIFVPIVMVPGFISFFFQQLAFTTTAVMSVSLLASLSLTPMIASRFLKTANRASQDSKNSFGRNLYQMTGRILDALDENYKNLLAWALGHRKLVLLLSLGLFASFILIMPFVGKELFPNMDHGQLQLNVEMPVGTRWEETAQVMEKVEKIIRGNVPEMKYILITAGSEEGNMMNSIRGIKAGSNYGTVISRLVPKEKRKRSTAQIEKSVEQKLLRIPGIKSIEFPESAGANRMAGAGRPISVEIYGYDLDKTDQLALQIKKTIDQIPGAVDTSISRKKGGQEFWVKVDREKASSLGLTVGEVALALRNYFYGNNISKYRESGDEYDIFVQLKKDNRQNIADLNNIFITTRTGQNISLSNMASIEKREAPLTIDRKNQQRVVMVEGDIRGQSPGEVNGKISKALNRIPLPPDITVKAGSFSEQMGKYFSQLMFALFVGIILVYLVMVAQFESLLEPFIIMFSVPFALAGVIWALFITKISLGIMTFIGMIMVVGIAVNNAIVLVDYTNIMRAKGLALFEAVLLSGRNRLRPILMTTMVTILGLLPMAVSTGEGAEMWWGMAYAIIGGLLVSTLFSLIFVPVVYTIVEQRSKQREYYGRVMKK